MSGVGQALSPEARAFLADVRTRHDAASVIEKLKSLSDMRVLVVGDTIIDEYHFCRPYGMPLKSPVIAAQFLEGEAHAGGVLAVANHLAAFCGEIDLMTGIGGLDSRQTFIREHLHARVKPTFFTLPEAPTTVKRRYVRRFLVQKLFEISFFDDRPPPAQVEQAILRQLEAVADTYDMVVVSDFGHGFITSNMIEVMCRKAKFLAVNTQLNSVNYGYHVVTKYPRADYACLDEEEARMACRDRTSPLEGLVEQIRKDLDCKMLTVTRGHHGSFTFRAGQKPIVAPVLSSEVVDTIGAGDAYFAITAPCAARGFAPDLTAFVGNTAGAMAVRVLGNQRAVETDAFVTLVKEMLA